MSSQSLCLNLFKKLVLHLMHPSSLYHHCSMNANIKLITDKLSPQRMNLDHVGDTEFYLAPPAEQNFHKTDVKFKSRYL